MARPFTHAQILQNQAFLRALARTGNAREAARALGVHRATFTRRRASHPAFAAQWDAMLAIAQASLGGRSSPRVPLPAAVPAAAPAVSAASAPEPRVTRTAGGRLQVRAVRPGGLTRAAEQAFLTALSATCNVRLAAKAAGFSHATFYARRRTSPGFAREMRLALQAGYGRLEAALIQASLPASHEDDAWRHNDPPPMPPTTAAQALQLLYLHQKEARLLAEPGHIKRRRGESSASWSYRLGAMYDAGQARRYEEWELAEAARVERGDPHPFGLDDPPALPDLAQVTGWSRADPAKPSQEEARARFWEGRRREGER